VVSASDCGVVRGPRFESRRGQLCYRNITVTYSLGHGLRTHTAVPRLTKPSTLRGTTDEYQLTGRVIITMATVIVDGS